MKPTKQLTNVTRIAEIDSSNIVLYFNDKRANIADKETFLEKYPSTCFSDWRPFNETFYLAQSLSNSNWTLVNKDTGEILNENLWFKKIETFNDEFFLITSPETSLKTLVYKKNGEFFNSTIYGERWEKINDNYFKVYDDDRVEIFCIVDKNRKIILCDEVFADALDFDKNLFAVGVLGNIPYYTFIKKNSGEYLNKDLCFDNMININDQICLIEIDDKYYFVTKTNGVITRDFPVLNSTFDINREEYYENQEFLGIEFDNDSIINRAILKTSDCTISPLYYDIHPFNKLYFAAYLDEYHITLMKKSDFSLLCNHMCVHENNITAYDNSDYFSIKDDNGTISIYQ